MRRRETSPGPPGPALLTRGRGCCPGAAVHCGILSSIFGFFPSDARSSLLVVTTPTSPDIAKSASGGTVRPRLRPQVQSLGGFGSSQHPLCCPVLAKAKLLRICKAHWGSPRALTTTTGRPGRATGRQAGPEAAISHGAWGGGSPSNTHSLRGGGSGEEGSSSSSSGDAVTRGQPRTLRPSSRWKARIRAGLCSSEGGGPAAWGAAQDTPPLSCRCCAGSSDASVATARRGPGSGVGPGGRGGWRRKHHERSLLPVPPDPHFPREGDEDSYHVPDTSVPDSKHSSRLSSRPSGKFTGAHTTPAGHRGARGGGGLTPHVIRGRCPDTWWAAPWRGSSATFPVPSDKRW